MIHKELYIKSGGTLNRPWDYTTKQDSVLDIVREGKHYEVIMQDRTEKIPVVNVIRLVELEDDNQ